MDVHILDVHAELLHRPHRLLHPEADKLPLFTPGEDHHATKQVILLHQPVHLLFIDHKAIRLQVFTDLDLAGKEHELLRNHKAVGDHHTLVLDDASITEHSMSRRFAALFAPVGMIIIRAVRKPAPMEQPGCFAFPVKELNGGAFLLDS